MKETLIRLFTSRKALAGIAGTVASTLVVLAGQKGWVIDAEAAKLLVMAILGLSGTFILGQGAADWGKEGAKIQEATATLVMTAKKKPTESEILES
jgi:hypothetical protein